MSVVLALSATTAAAQCPTVAADSNLAGRSLVGCNLSGADLTRVIFRGASLYTANLGGATLDRANFIGADLRGIDLQQAHGTGVHMSGAHVTDGKLAGLILTDSDLHGADLQRATLTGAQLVASDLSGADLTGANLSNADLRRVNLSRADLSPDDVFGCHGCPAAVLTGADLRDATLASTDLRGVDLSFTQLEGADLRGALIQGASFECASVDRRTLGAPAMPACPFAGAVPFDAIGLLGIQGLGDACLQIGSPDETCAARGWGGLPRLNLPQMLVRFDESSTAARISRFVPSSDTVTLLGRQVHVRVSRCEIADVRDGSYSSSELSLPIRICADVSADGLGARFPLDIDLTTRPTASPDGVHRWDGSLRLETRDGRRVGVADLAGLGEVSGSESDFKVMIPEVVLAWPE